MKKEVSKAYINIFLWGGGGGGGFEVMLTAKRQQRKEGIFMLSKEEKGGEGGRNVSSFWGRGNETIAKEGAQFTAKFLPT